MIQQKEQQRYVLLTYLVLAFVCFAAMNVINRYYYFIFIAMALFCLTPNRKVRVEPGACFPLLVIALSWALFSPESTGSIFGGVKPFPYLLCYIMGCSLISDDKEFSGEKTPFKLFYITVAVIGIGMLTHYVLNWSVNIDTVDRNTIDFWTRRPMAATGQASLACLPLGLAVACMLSKSGKKVKIAALVTILVVILYNFILSGRTIFILLLASSAIAFLYRLSMQTKNKIRSILVVFVVVIIAVLIYRQDVLGIRSFIEETPFYKRFFGASGAMGIDEDNRLENKINYIGDMLGYWYGGSNLREMYGYAHDILLDTYDEAGLFALIAMVSYLAVTVSHLVSCLKNKRLPFMFRQTVLCIYFACYLEFMVEPILQGMPWLFASFCLIDGYVSRILLHDKKIKSGAS